MTEHEMYGPGRIRTDYAGRRTLNIQGLARDGTTLGYEIGLDRHVGATPNEIEAMRGSRPGHLIEFKFGHHERRKCVESVRHAGYFWGFVWKGSDDASLLVFSSMHPNVATMMTPHWIYAAPDVLEYKILDQRNAEYCTVPYRQRRFDKQFPKAEAYLRYMVERDGVSPRF